MKTRSIFLKVKHEKFQKLSLDGCHLDMLRISKRFKREFETAIVNELSVFEPLKFDCIL